MILLSAIELEDCKAAYHWHRGFAGANDALYPRTFDDFEQLVMDGCVWAARSTNLDYLALAYASYDEVAKVCEIGGLMVAKQAEGKGLGSLMMRLAMAHAILEENLLSIPGVRIIAHVLRTNNDPRAIIERKLRFRLVNEVAIPSTDLPGLRAEEDGMVHGLEYELVTPDSIDALADWATAWTGRLSGDEVADIELRPGVTMTDWAKALHALAAESRADIMKAANDGPASQGIGDETAAE